MNTEIHKCALCGEPMPEGEQMFKYHGYSGPCPKPPLVKPTTQPPAPAHDFYKTGDADAPDQIRDRNGAVVLQMCRRCGKAEIELENGAECLPKAPAFTAEEMLAEVETRVMPSICRTLGMKDGVMQERIEGRIDADDFNIVIRLARKAALSTAPAKPKVTP